MDSEAGFDTLTSCFFASATGRRIKLALRFEWALDFTTDQRHDGQRGR
jgi:hypothetical protein